MLSLNEIVDGLSRTIWIGQIEAAYPPWARPETLAIRPAAWEAEWTSSTRGGRCLLSFLSGWERRSNRVARSIPGRSRQLADPDDGVPPESEFSKRIHSTIEGRDERVTPPVQPRASLWFGLVRQCAPSPAGVYLVGAQ